MSKKLNGTYQANVILRMFDNDEKKMGEWHEEYKSHLIWNRREATPSKKDYKIVEDYKRGMVVRELSEKHKLTPSQIKSAIFRVAKYELVHG